MGPFLLDGFGEQIREADVKVTFPKTLWRRRQCSMITGRDFVVLCDDWNGSPTSAIHLFNRISQRNRVFWVNTINRMPRLTRRDGEKVVRFVRRWCGQSIGAAKRGVESELTNSHGLHITSPPMIPRFSPLVRRLNRKMLLRSYNRLSVRYHIRDPILVAVYPSAVDLVTALDVHPKIYYCLDDWPELPGFNPDHWRTMENLLLDDVDGLVVTSRHLGRKKGRTFPSLHLPHGVDFQHFGQNANGLAAVPQLDEIKRPIVGFFGVIGKWVDIELIATLSKTLPDVSFVVIGGADVDTTAIMDRPNVYCLGPIPYAELPRYARYFNVGLIPFVTNELTRAVNPLKLMEYYALGLPVLATRLPELEEVAGPVYLASTQAEFCAQLKKILASGPHSRSSEAIEVARQNTWDQRVEDLSMFVEDLEQKNPSRDVA